MFNFYSMQYERNIQSLNDTTFSQIVSQIFKIFADISAMKFHSELFCIVTYKSWFLVRWLTQLLLSIVGDVESNPGHTHRCAQCRCMQQLVLLYMYTPQQNTITNNSHPSKNTQNKTDTKHAHTTNQHQRHQQQT